MHLPNPIADTAIADTFIAVAAQGIDSGASVSDATSPRRFLNGLTTIRPDTGDTLKLGNELGSHTCVPMEE